MEKVEKAFETTATINADHQLVLDRPLPITGPTNVRIIILMPEEEADINEKEWLGSAVINPAFDFLKDSEEDIYTLADGKPFHDEG